MSFLLILLYIAFTGIILFPFYYVYTKRERGVAEQDHTLQEKRRLLLDNLKDLKMEFDTGKLTDAEFNELSRGLVYELKVIDESKPEVKTEVAVKKAEHCPGCGKEIVLKEAKFCPFCGNSL